MALHTLGTSTTTAIQTALVVSEALLDQDIGALNMQVAPDLYTAQPATVPDSPGVAGIVITGNTTAASPTVAAVALIAGAPLTAIQPGMQILAQNLPPGTSVVSYAANVLILSANYPSLVTGAYFLIVPAGGTARGTFSRNGELIIPNRGLLKMRRGDVVAVDNTGWPILVSGASANFQSSNWVFT